MKPDEFITNQPDTDQILYYLTSAARSMLKDVDSMYGPDAKQDISYIYNWLRGDLKEGNFAEFEKSYDMALRKYPDAASELYDVMYEHAGLGMDGTYEEFMAKCTDNGMSEGIGSTIKRGIKSIKRGMQGWGQLADIPDDDPRLLPGAKDSPRQLVARNKGYDDKTVRQLARPIKSSYPFGGDDTTSPHSPRGLQKRVLDREMKKRGLGEDASCGATSAGAFATGAVGAAKPKKIIRRKSAVGEGIDQVEEFKAPDAHPFNKRTDAELKGFVKDAPEAAASIKKRGGNSAKIEKDAVTANVIKQSRQNDPRK